MTRAQFWRGRRVFLTGHTGFKGAWMALWLEQLGANVTGYALAPTEDHTCAYSCFAPWPRIRSVIGDVRDPEAVQRAVEDCDPEIVIHMAAQALVRRSYADPVQTFGTNVMGTVHILAAVAQRTSVRAILVVTSDKVYDNNESGRAFREEDPLAGEDPYSASKAGTELVVRSWRRSFMADSRSAALGVARAGNVIGGGDWGEDRLVPDIIRAGLKDEPVVLRYPFATRPWQHVLDVVSGYLSYAERLMEEPGATPQALNFGPRPGRQALKVCEIVDELQKACGWSRGWIQVGGKVLREKAQLALDSSRAAKALGWVPKLTAADALAWTARWHRSHLEGCDMRERSLMDIAEFGTLPMSVQNRTAAE
jgi:CDP-glucose 4,6-dehydratase